MTFLQKVFAGLRSAGLSEEKALGYAEMIERKEKADTGVSITHKVVNKKTDKVSNGGTSATDDILTYCQSRKGNVILRAQMAAKLDHISSGLLSTSLTHLVRKGALNRVGRGEYVCAKGTC